MRKGWVILGAIVLLLAAALFVSSKLRPSRFPANPIHEVGLGPAAV